MPAASATPAEVGAFLACKTQADLAAFLGTTEGRLTYFLYSASAPTYSVFHVPKAAGGFREIHAPPRIVRAWQSRLVPLLSARYVTKLAVHGFVSGRSIKTNAEVHVQRRTLLTVDLKDFFPSIHFGRIRGVFLKPPFSFANEVASTLAQLCTSNGALTQGAPTSPVLSNFVCRRMDIDLLRLASKYKCRYSRYADDITLSTNAPSFPINIVAGVDPYGQNVALGPELSSVFANHDFTPNPAKTRVRAVSRRREVTGLIVNEKVNVPRAFIMNMRAALDAWRRKGLPTAESEFHTLDAARMHRPFGPPKLATHLRGKLDYLKMVRGADDLTYVRYALEASELPGNFRPVELFAHPATIEPFLERAVWALRGVDASGTEVCQGTAFYLSGAGFVTARHIIADAPTKPAKWVLARLCKPFDITPVKGWWSTKDVDIALLESDALSHGHLVRSHAAIVLGGGVRVVGLPHHGPGGKLLSAPTVVTQRKTISTIEHGLVEYPILPGASGGPVFDGNGQVIGVVSTSKAHAVTPNAFIHIQHLAIAQGAPGAKL